jgi:predicted membrane-bound spermidine synthase
MTNQKTGMKGIPVALVLSLFFVSGATALVYQVVWSRMMMHVFGSTALAVGTVLAAFMSGMALGAWLIGRMADDSRNCLRLYAWLELGIALAALLSHPTVQFTSWWVLRRPYSALSVSCWHSCW